MKKKCIMVLRDFTYLKEFEIYKFENLDLDLIPIFKYKCLELGYEFAWYIESIPGEVYDYKVIVYGPIMPSDDEQIVIGEKLYNNTNLNMIYNGYPIGTEVYAIADWFKDNKPTGYIGIFKAIVDGIYFDATKCEYYLKTPSGEDWGDVVDSAKVNTDEIYLLRYMRDIWDKDGDYI